MTAYVGHPNAHGREQDRTPTARTWIDTSTLLAVDEGHRIAYRRTGSGPAITLLHGFPTWSYDYAAVAQDLSRDHTVITLDFLGYGASDKPRAHEYSVAASADAVAAVLASEGISETRLVVHDYGGIVGQELLDRHRRGVLPFDVARVDLLNSGIVYAEYRPTLTQRLLSIPVAGSFLARVVVTRTGLKRAVDGVRGRPTTDAEFDELWLGISLAKGHKIAHQLLGYNAERRIHHVRWEKALSEWEGPLQLIWGTADPVSGEHVLTAAIPRLPHAKVIRLDGVGHFPQAENPEAVIEALRSGT